MDRSFWAIFLTIAIIETITWLAVFEHNYHPRVYRSSKDVTILQVGESELDFNPPAGAFTIWSQSGRRNVGMFPRRGITWGWYRWQLQTGTHLLDRGEGVGGDSVVCRSPYRKAQFYPVQA